MDKYVNKKIKSFTDLRVWQNGHDLVLRLYRITRMFPRDEMFGLASQLKRAGVSFTSNIAEGFTRRFIKEKKKFYYISLGSLVEVQNQLLVSRDIGYINKVEFKYLADQTVQLSKMINGLIKGIDSIDYLP